MDRNLTLRIILRRPPADVDFAIQKGKGTDYETFQKQRSSGNDLSFEFPVEVKDTRSDGAPNFLGPFAQGPPTGRFVYIDIGQYAGQKDTGWSRRLKISLGGITWAMLGKESDPVLETKVTGTGRDGGPTCGTAKDVVWESARKRR